MDGHVDAVRGTKGYEGYQPGDVKNKTDTSTQIAQATIPLKLEEVKIYSNSFKKGDSSTPAAGIIQRIFQKIIERRDANRVKNLINANMPAYIKYVNKLPESVNKYLFLVTLIKADLKNVDSLQDINSNILEKAIDDKIFSIARNDMNSPIFKGQRAYILKAGITTNTLSDLMIHDADTTVNAVKLYLKDGGDTDQAALNIANALAIVQREDPSLAAKIIAKLQKDPELKEVAKKIEQFREMGITHIKTKEELLTDIRSIYKNRRNQAVDFCMNLAKISPEKGAELLKAVMKELNHANKKDKAFIDKINADPRFNLLLLDYGDVKEIKKINMQSGTEENIPISEDSITNIKEISSSALGKTEIKVCKDDYPRFVKSIFIKGQTLGLSDKTINNNHGNAIFFHNAVEQKLKSEFKDHEESVPFIMAAMNQSSFATIQMTLFNKVQEMQPGLMVNSAENVQFHCNELSNQDGTKSLQIKLQGSFPVLYGENKIGTIPFTRTITIPFDSVPEFKKDDEGKYIESSIHKGEMDNLTSQLTFGHFIPIEPTPPPATEPVVAT